MTTASGNVISCKLDIDMKTVMFTKRSGRESKCQQPAEMYNDCIL
jgi:hypothetical protein